MVLSFLAGSKHAPVYASSGMYVVVLFVFAGSTCALVVLICSRAHLELPVGFYMQRFFVRMQQICFGILMRTTHVCATRVHLLLKSCWGRWVYIAMGSIDSACFASTVVFILVQPCPTSAHGSQALLELVGHRVMF